MDVGRIEYDHLPHQVHDTHTTGASANWTISLGIGALRALKCPELRSWLSASDREIPFFTGVNGTLMARRP
jgi:hypothetical protein